MATLPISLNCDDHYTHSLDYIISDNSGNPLLCYICTLSTLRNKGLDFRKYPVLEIIRTTLSRYGEDPLTSFLRQNPKYTQPFLLTILDQLLENSFLAESAQKSLFLFLPNLCREIYQLDVMVTEHIVEMLSHSETETGYCLLKTLEKLLKEFPRSMEHFIHFQGSPNGTFVEVLITSLRHSTESYQQSGISIILQFLSHPAVNTNRIFSDRVWEMARSILSILKSSRDADLLYNCLGIFKMMACSGPLSQSSYETWFGQGSLPSIFNKLIRENMPKVQAAVAQCVSHLLKLTSQNAIAVPLFINQEFPDSLFDALLTKDNLVISSVLCCATLLISDEEIYNQNQLPFCIVKVKQTASFLMDNKFWDICVDALRLISKMVESIAGMEWGVAKECVFQNLTELVSSGLRIEHGQTITCVVHLFYKMISQRENLPTPIPLTTLKPPFEKCLEFLMTGPQRLKGRDDFAISFECRQKGSRTERQINSSEFNKINILFKLLRDVSVLVEECNSDPINREATYGESRFGDSRATAVREEPVSPSYFLELVFDVLEHSAIPAFCAALSKETEAELVVSLFGSLIAASTADAINGGVNFTRLCWSLLKGSFFTFLWDYRMSDKSTEYLKRDHLLRLSNECLKSLFRHLIDEEFKGAPDLETLREAAETGVLGLRDSFEDSMTCLRGKADKEDRVWSSTRVLCLLHYYFIRKYDKCNVIESRELVDSVTTYILCNLEELDSSPPLVIRVVAPLVALASLESTAESGGMLEYRVNEASGRFVESLSERGVESVLSACEPHVLLWIFTNTENMDKLGESAINFWLKNLGGCSSDEEAKALIEPLEELLLHCEESRNMVWNAFKRDDVTVMDAVVKLMTTLSRGVVEITLSLLKRMNQIFSDLDCSDYARDRLTFIISVVRAKHDIADTETEEWRMIHQVCRFATKKDPPPSKEYLANSFWFLSKAIRQNSKINNSAIGAECVLTFRGILEVVQKMVDGDEVPVEALQLVISADRVYKEYNLKMNLTPVTFKWNKCNLWLKSNENPLKIKFTLQLLTNYARAGLAKAVYEIDFKEPREWFLLSRNNRVPKDLPEMYIRLLILLSEKNIIYDTEALAVFETFTNYYKGNRELYQYCAEHAMLKRLRRQRPDDTQLKLE